MIVALDYRPALLLPTGIARVVRELAGRLAGQPGIEEVRLFGHCLAPARVPPPPLPPRTRLHRWPLPGRALPALARLGVGADTLCGGCDLFLWTDFVFPPVRRARVAMILHDLAFLVEPAWHAGNAGDLAARTQAAARRAVCIIVPSPQVAGDAARLLPEASGRIRVVPWGGDHAPSLARPEYVPAELRPEPEAPLFLAIGTVEPRKDHATLLAAFAAVRRQLPSARLVVAGRAGWAEAETLARLAALARNPAAGVVWRQDLPDLVLLGLLAQATALVYPSRYEGFGLPVAEALALGVPAIVAAGTAPAWVAGRGGLTFPPGEAEALAGCMVDLARGGELRRKLGLVARQCATTWTWARAGAALAEALAAGR